MNTRNTSEPENWDYLARSAYAGKLREPPRTLEPRLAIARVATFARRLIAIERARALRRGPGDSLHSPAQRSLRFGGRSKGSREVDASRAR